MSGKRSLPFLALVGALLVAPFARAADAASSEPPKPADKLSSECIAPDAYKQLETCPGGPKQFDIHQKRGAAFKSAPPPVEKKDRKDDLKPQNPSEAMAAGQRDERWARMDARLRRHSAAAKALTIARRQSARKGREARMRLRQAVLQGNRNSLQFRQV